MFKFLWNSFAILFWAVSSVIPLLSLPSGVNILPKFGRKIGNPGNHSISLQNYSPACHWAWRIVCSSWWRQRVLRSWICCPLWSRPPAARPAGCSSLCWGRTRSRSWWPSSGWIFWWKIRYLIGLLIRKKAYYYFFKLFCPGLLDHHQDAGDGGIEAPHRLP